MSAHSLRQLIKRRASSLIATRFSKHVLQALTQLRTEYHIQRIHRRDSKRARELAARRPLKLNFASGFHPKPGWVNIDLFAPGADLRLDLREPLPFATGSADAIYAEHFFEHLNYPGLADSAAWDGPEHGSEALQFLRECHRVLKPGGVLDLVVPDAEQTLEEYVHRHSIPRHEAWWGPRWCDTPMHIVNYVFRQGSEHKYAYDRETLTRVLADAGFGDVQTRLFDPALEAPNHEFGSLCVRARKPLVVNSNQPADVRSVASA